MNSSDNWVCNIKKCLTGLAQLAWAHGNRQTVNTNMSWQVVQMRNS